MFDDPEPAGYRPLLVKLDQPNGVDDIGEQDGAVGPLHRSSRPAFGRGHPRALRAASLCREALISISRLNKA